MQTPLLEIILWNNVDRPTSPLEETPEGATGLLSTSCVNL